MTEPQPNWRDTLPDDIKADATLATIPDINTLAKNHIALKAMTGRKSYDLPRDDWKPEDWKAWNASIGVPEGPDKYNQPGIEALEKAGVPAETLKAAMAKFHEAGLTPRQSKALVDWYLSDATKGAELIATQTAAEKVAAEKALQQEYGDKYAAKMGLVKSFLGKFGSAELVQWAEESGAGNNPAFVKALIKAGEALLEDSSRRGSPQPPGTESASALAEIDEMKTRRLTDKAYSEKFNDPKSPERVRWNLLHDVAFQQKRA